MATDDVPDALRAASRTAQTIRTGRRSGRLLCEPIPEAIVQERVYGLEFTTDCLVDRDGRASVILRRRDLVRAGLAVASTTFEDDTVCSLFADTLRAVRAAGLSYVRPFVTDDGRVAITEQNVQVANGFPLTEAAGEASGR